MDFFKSIFFLLLFLFPVTLATQNCTSSKCSNSGFNVRFPFTLEAHQPRSCGYPGFELSCNARGMTVLNLPSGELSVRNISYNTQTIQLRDPKNCLPKRLLSLNLSGTPYTPIYSQEYVFLSCESEFVESWVTPIGCLSNSTNAVVAMAVSEAIPLSTCNEMFTLTIPISSQFRGMPFSDLSDDLHLTWNAPNCKKCEARGGLCKLKSNTSQKVTCSKTGKNPSIVVFGITSITVAAIAVTITLGLACFTCYSEKRLKHRNSDLSQENHSIAVVSSSSTRPILGELSRPVITTSGPGNTVQPNESTNSPSELSHPLVSTSRPGDTLQPIESTNSISDSSHPIISTTGPRDTLQPIESTTVYDYFFDYFNRINRDNRRDSDEFSVGSSDNSIVVDDISNEIHNRIVIYKCQGKPEPNGDSCPICLSEYKPGETIGRLPGCIHGFHAKCIDEWLNRKRTCPVCRSSQSPHQYSSSPSVSSP